MGRARSISLLVVLAMLSSLATTLPGAAPPADAVGERLRLSGSLAAGETVTSYSISPDSRWAVFLISDGVTSELFSAPLDSTEPTPTPLSVAPTGEPVSSFRISPDSQWVVYEGALTDATTDHLYSRRIDGSGAQEQLSSTVALGVFGTPTISPNSARVIWLGEHELAGRRDLYSAPIDGSGSQVRLSDPAAPANTDLGVSFRTFPGDRSDWVVFGGDLRLDGVTELFARRTNGSGSQVKLNTDPVGDGPASVTFSPDDQYAVFQAELDSATSYGLYARPVDGSSPQVKLSPEPAGTGQVVGGFGRQFSESTGRVLFVGDLLTDGVWELFSAPWDGSGSAIRLNDPPEPGGGELEGSGGSWDVSPDGQTVVYTASLLDAARDDIFSAPVDATGGQVRLSSSPTGESVTASPAISPDGQYAMYRGELDVVGRPDVFVAPLGQSGQQATMAQATAGLFGAFPLSPMVGDRIGLSGYVEGATTLGLWSVTPGMDDLVRIDDPGAGEVSYALLPSNDATRLVWLGDHETAGDHELWSAPLDGSGAPVKLNHDVPAGFSIPSTPGPILSEDSRWVVWSSAEDTADFGQLELFATQAGQQPPLAPTDPDVAVGVEQLTVSWNPPPGGSQVTGYVVTCTPVGTGGAPVEVAAGQDATSAEVTGLHGGTAYDCVVAAVNDAGTGAATDAVTATPLVPVELVRYAGLDRFDTARLVAAGEFDPTAVATAYIATGADYPDALTGGPSATRDGAPLLLVAPGRVPDPTAEALDHLGGPDGLVLGGPGAVGDDVVTALDPFTATLDRVFGTNRFGTAAAIADRYDSGDVDTVYVATGTNYPDALSGAPGAVADGGPLLLVTPTRIPDETVAALDRLEPNRIVVLGGAAAVGDAVVDALGDHAPNVDVLAGDDRFETAALVAQRFAPADVHTVFVATGLDYPDALAGGAAVAAQGGVLLLVARDRIPEATATELSRLQPRRIVVLGGNAAVAESLDAELATYLGAG